MFKLTPISFKSQLSSQMGSSLGLGLLCGLGHVLSPLWTLVFSMGQVRDLDLVTSKGLSCFTIRRGVPSPLSRLFLTTIDLLLFLLFFKYLETF